MANLKIEKKNITDLIPAKYNPRKDLKPGDEEYESLKRSIENFGYVAPIIWNKTTGHIVGGHQRLKVLLAMGETEVDCVVIEKSEAEEKLLNVALNKISGDWDNDRLALLFADLDKQACDVTLTGFDLAEIDNLFKPALKDQIKDDEFDVDAELQKPTFTKAGDVWTLGRHRLICGDSTKSETIETLMNGIKANLVITDPPYNVNYEGTAGKIKNDNMADDVFYNFLLDSFKNAINVMADDASIYVFHADTEGLNFRKAFADAGFYLSGCCIWKKQSLVLGRSPYQSRSIGYEEETSPTLRAGVVPATVALENHPTDSRIKVADDGKVQTLTSRMGTGGNNVPLVLKIRSGCEGGGKGALIQEDRSATLSCNNDQTLFEPCSWDGKQTAPTLTAHNAGGNQRMPDKKHFNCVLQAFGICSKDSNAMKSENPNSGIYKADTSRTLDANGGNPGCNQGGIAVVCVDQGGGKSSCGVTEELSPTLACTHGGEPAVCIQGSMIGRNDKNGPQGDGINEDVSFTLNTVDRHAVYAMTTGSYAQVTENKAPTLLSRDYKDATVVTQPSYGIGRDAFNQGKNAQYKPCIEEEKQPTLVAKGPGALAQPISFYPQMKAECQTPRENISNTLVNGTNPGFQNGVVETSYTVRRLTPTECARLQGFPDWWCSNLETTEPSMDDIRYWYDVFETHRIIMGTSSKPKTLKQIARWLKAPHSDSAEYKMWGNGVALPCVYFVLSGIVWYTQNEA